MLPNKNLKLNTDEKVTREDDSSIQRQPTRPSLEWLWIQKL